MDELDRKALYWCLKLSHMALYGQTFFGKEPVQLQPGIDEQTALTLGYCLDKANTVRIALGVELGIDDN